MFNIYSSGLQGGSNYFHPCPEHTYSIPDDFNIDAYKYLNESTKSLHYDQIIDHYLNIGRHQNLLYTQLLLLPVLYMNNVMASMHKLRASTVRTLMPATTSA
jgi:hypothetical protein